MTLETNRITTDEYAATAEFYDYITPYRDRQDVQFFVDYAREANGTVLEIGCGTGRVLIPTAQAGFKITGIDNSDAMLEICRRKLAAEPKDVQSRVHLEKADMRSFDLDERFDLITIPFRPFQHLITVEDQLACLKQVHRHLKPGGKFILDLFNPSIPMMANPSREEKYGAEPEFTMPDGRKIVRWHRIPSQDYNAQVLHAELIHEITNPDGTKDETIFAFDMRYLFRYEAEHLLARSGFKLETVYADYNRTPFGSKYPSELILVATK